MTELVRIDGLKELDACLAALPAMFRRATVLRALKKASKPMVVDARARARRQANPVRRGGVLVGSRMANKWGLGTALADSITARPKRASSGAPSEVAVAIGPGRGHFYAPFIEFGTAPSPGRAATPRQQYERISKTTGQTKAGWTRAHAARRAHAGTRPYPFLRPAFDSNAGRVMAAFREELWNSVKDQVATLARRANAGTLSAKAAAAVVAHARGTR